MKLIKKTSKIKLKTNKINHYKKNKFYKARSHYKNNKSYTKIIKILTL